MTSARFPSLGEVIFQMTLQDKAISKERPRSGKAGHFFTPKRTREFEAHIQSMARLVVTHEVADYPVRVDIAITEPVPPSWPKWRKDAAEAGHIVPTRGDLDNKRKAICDALNGIVYVDDRLVAVERGDKAFGRGHTIKVTIYRTGLSLEEAQAYWQGRKYADNA